MPSSLRHAALLKVAQVLGPSVLRAWVGTLRVSVFTKDASILPTRKDGQGIMFAGWHESLLVPATLYGKCHPYALVSQSRDGEYIARILSRLGWHVVRGSTRRGAVAAMWELMDRLRTDEGSDVFIATDGPRGPRRFFKEGAIYLASHAGRPLVLAGIAHDRPWRARSWDRLVLPRPFSRVCLAFSAPIDIPRNVNRRNFASVRQHVQAAMDDAQATAEQHLAEQIGLRPNSIGIKSKALAEGNCLP